MNMIVGLITDFGKYGDDMNNNKIEIMLCRSIDMLIKNSNQEYILEQLMITKEEYEDMLKNKNEKVLSLYNSRRNSIENLSNKLKIPKIEIEEILKENKVEIRTQYKDITGKKYGRLTVLKEFGRNKSREILWECKCDCGNSKTVKITYTNLTHGNTQSCGCLQKERASISNKTHGDSKEKLFMVWSDMRARCNRKTHHAYGYYGGRGIKICEDWDSNYETFKGWAVETGYKHGLTIDRIDNDKNYEPSNCKWATMKEQCNNRSTNKHVYFINKKFTISDFCKTFKISVASLYKYTDGMKNASFDNIILCFENCIKSGNSKCVLNMEDLKYIKEKYLNGGVTEEEWDKIYHKYYRYMDYL